MSPRDPEVPPVGEEIHLPGPSILPLLLAVGITLAVIGVTLGLALLIGGSVLSLLVMGRWIYETKRDIDDLPQG